MQNTSEHENDCVYTSQHNRTYIRDASSVWISIIASQNHEEGVERSDNYLEFTLEVVAGIDPI